MSYPLDHCDRLPRVMSTEDWLAQHSPHGQHTKTYPDPQPPSYRLARLRCPCGATHTAMEEEAPE